MGVFVYEYPGRGGDNEGHIVESKTGAVLEPTVIYISHSQGGPATFEGPQTEKCEKFLNYIHLSFILV